MGRLWVLYPMSAPGDRLPDPYYDRVRDLEVAYFRVRKCEICGREWTTAEIPMFPKWTSCKANRCPRGHRSIIKRGSEVPPHKFRSSDTQWPDGVVKAFVFGGVYRRRECASRCKYKRKISRWSTMELLPEGFICEDVTKCFRCGGPGRVLPPKQPRKWRLEDDDGNR